MSPGSFRRAWFHSSGDSRHAVDHGHFRDCQQPDDSLSAARIAVDREAAVEKARINGRESRRSWFRGSFDLQDPTCIGAMNRARSASFWSAPAERSVDASLCSGTLNRRGQPGARPSSGAAALCVRKALEGSSAIVRGRTAAPEDGRAPFGTSSCRAKILLAAADPSARPRKRNIP